MKQETKELVRWIKNHISVANNKDAELYLHKAFDFLDSLPEIEKKLCFGGYIQDKNGTPCCDGDKVVYTHISELTGTRLIGTLRWDQRCGKFRIHYGQGGIIHVFITSDIEKIGLHKVGE